MDSWEIVITDRGVDQKVAHYTAPHSRGRVKQHFVQRGDNTLMGRTFCALN